MSVKAAPLGAAKLPLTDTLMAAAFADRKCGEFPGGASQTRRKAAYPNSYAASEGAPVGQDGAHDAELEAVVLARARFAELEGEALARAIDDEVEEEVAASPLVSPLLVVADAQVQAIQSLQAVHASFREALSPPSASSDQSHQPSDASNSDKSAPSAPHSPEVLKRLQELQTQIEEIEKQHAETNAKLRAAEAEARQQARAHVAASLGSGPANALPQFSNIRRWLKAV